jgi:hypothetical protein
VGDQNENLVYTSPWDFKKSFTCHKILRHGTSGFTSHLKEGVLRIFIALKNPSPWPGSNPQPFGSVASTPKTTPPRQLLKCYFCDNQFIASNLTLLTAFCITTNK